jgi:hypothetical protein
MTLLSIEKATGQMIFMETNNQKFELQFKYHDLELLTGIKEESDYCVLNLKIKDAQTSGSILISDAKKIIDWFEGILLTERIDLTLFLPAYGLSFELVENKLTSKIIRITLDHGAATRGNGAYSLSSKAKRADFSQKIFTECNMDDIELQRTVNELKAELNSCIKR